MKISPGRDLTKKAEKLTWKKEKKYTPKEMDLTKKNLKNPTRKRDLTQKKLQKPHQEERETIHTQSNGFHKKTVKISSGREISQKKAGKGSNFTDSRRKGRTSKTKAVLKIGDQMEQLETM